jgi:hypothetical protein
MGTKARQWTLDDGTTWTTKALGEAVGCSASSAYHRLNKSSDPTYVLRPLEDVKRVNGYRIYVLDDGSEWTSRMVAEKTGCLLSTAATRLSCYTDVDKIMAPPLKKLFKDRMENNAMKNRMYFDPLGHWKLLNRCL